MAFDIEFSERARSNLESLRKRDQRIIVEAIAVHLCDQPEVATKRRKRLEENSLAPWELRIGAFRAFYDVDNEHSVVIVLAVGQKDHNVLRIGGEEIEL
jgi:mRNA-degrading endonuclease RelE of RelBE toxin-antitoxin system